MDRYVPCEACRPKADAFFAGLSAIPGNEEALEAAKAMAQDPKGWLVLVGPVGTGKTTLLRAIVSGWARETREPRQCGLLLDFWRSRFDEGDFQEVFGQSLAEELFALDDLGSERPTEWAVERLFLLLDYRYQRQLPTVIATNCDEARLAAQMGTRLADRVFDRKSGLVKVVVLRGPSLRTGKRW